MIRSGSLALLKQSCLLIAAFALPVRTAGGDPLAEIKELRAAEFLNTAKRQALKAWIGKQVEVLLDEDVELAEKRRIRQIFDQAVRRDPVPGQHFKEKFAEGAVEVFGPHLKDGEPGGALMMVMILHDLRDLLPRSSLRKGGLLAALFHPVPAVKYWAARTIRLLHENFAEAAGPRGTVIDALREAGIQETNGQALREIYLALDFSKTVGKVDFGGEVAEALVDILEVRGGRYALGEVAVSDGDLAGLSAMARLAGPMTDKEQAKLRTRYLTALARMLCRIVDEYAALLDAGAELDRDRRMRVRRLLLVCRGIESELARVVKASGTAKGAMPNLYARMQGGVEEELLLERNNWCGWPPNMRGVLNHEALGVPLGAGYTELKRRAEPRPASTQPESPPGDEASDR